MLDFGQLSQKFWRLMQYGEYVHSMVSARMASCWRAVHRITHVSTSAPFKQSHPEIQTIIMPEQMR